MPHIKFVYFDVGGVTILDFTGTNKWTEMKQALGVTERNDKEFNRVWDKYLPRMCIDCDVDLIVSQLKAIEGISVPDNYSMLTDFVERFETNPSIWPILSATKQRFQVGLLTNMFPGMLEIIKEKQLIPSLDWDAVVDSSQVRYQKPQPEIYQEAEKLAKVAPSEIFFIDNTEEHVVAAQQRGWQTFLYDSRQPAESSQKLAQILNL